jgi:hypothetical protein
VDHCLCEIRFGKKTVIVSFQQIRPKHYNQSHLSKPEQSVLTISLFYEED